MEEADFDEWYRREHPRLSTSLVVITADPVLAGDVADEAFARAYERWERVGRMTSPGGWTYRTALNVLRRHHRRLGLEARLLRRGSVSDHAAPPDWSAEVWEALLALPRRERTALALRFVADLPSVEVAAVMGVTAGTVGSMLASARERLARSLTETQEATDA